MTIYEIKNRLQNAPHFFDRKSMKFFNQTMRDFKVYKMGEDKYRLVAPMKDYTGCSMGQTERIFNAQTNKFE
jgi:hypothetical protein